MKKRGIRPIYVKSAILCLLLLVAEFVFPNYVTRIAARIANDTGALIRGEDFSEGRVASADMVLTNEFEFQFVALEDAPSQRPAGVLGPDDEGRFVVVEQSATEIAGRDVPALLEAIGATYPAERWGGIQQLIEIDGALFALLGLGRGDCLFAALVDLERLQVVEEFPCLSGDQALLSMNSIGGGYAVMNGTSFMLALGTGADTTWSQANDAAQDPSSPYGKVLRYDIVTGDDGPRLTNRSIVSSGHRNPQGMMRFGEMLLAVEHGPRGGDEINVIELGANYGWPLFSAGSQYNDGDMTSFAPEGSDYSNPLFTFVPSIAISDISACPSVIATRYETTDCVIVSGLASEAIFIVLGDFANQRVRSVERIDVGVRVREVFIHDDALYLLPDRSTLIRADIAALPCTGNAGQCGRED